MTPCAESHAQRGVAGDGCEPPGTALTMLGMVIGVGAVVLMMAIGRGATRCMRQTISTMGSNLFIVLPAYIPAASAPAAARRR